MERTIFDDEHHAFREMVRDFLEKEVAPYHEDWEKQGHVSRDVWLSAGKTGLLGLDVEERFGGGGVDDLRFMWILTEEISRSGFSGLGFPLSNDVVTPYLTELTTEEQKERWLPRFCSGEMITAIAMTEPGTGSDLQGIQTKAVRDGDEWVINGAKTFITNGIMSDLVIVVCKTDADAGSHGFSLIAVERDTPGFERGRHLDKIGMVAQDTAELSFTDCRVPASNLVGQEGQGFIHLMQNLPRERMSIAIAATAGAEKVLDDTITYVKERKAFGRPIASLQNTRFTVAELKTKLAVTREFVDRCIVELNAKKLGPADASMAKYWATETAKEVIDRCLQLHGGYGYMREYPVAKAFLDNRVQTIYGGTTEIMKEIIGRVVLS
ncbi:acyl-CoA dehydrogenase family protein [Actinomycetospora sp. TBRC 11914]|uniref:acyl-CoA dehydrogenase family protein n=1 Tax=Actinomycetospora sp. TBRC 11914 TaxID=2729387 RepID=UPI00145E02EA|nr:acyl-CoA dehydrogenase family protein [Actinomycetospora sp. TBRC 11914]NMO91934.1 acyl-CoA dehydrogenase [Actinomycetospora sp. TBRC 11914]